MNRLKCFTEHYVLVTIDAFIEKKQALKKRDASVTGSHMRLSANRKKLNPSETFQMLLLEAIFAKEGLNFATEANFTGKS